MKERRTLLRCLIAAMVGLVSFALYGEVKVEEGVSEQWGEYIVMENQSLRVSTAKTGAKIRQVVDKSTGKKLIDPACHLGMFLDNFVGEGNAGPFTGAKFIIDIRKKGPEEAEVLFSCQGPSEGWTPITRDMLLTKTYVLPSEKPYLQVKIGLTNKGRQGKSFSYWSKNDFYVSGSRENKLYFRPASTGISAGSIDKDGKSTAPACVMEPTAGWMAALDTSTRASVIFLVDYNYTRWLYNCFPYHTTEIFYDMVSLPPGRTWETEIRLLVKQGFDGMVHASPYLVADCRMEHSGEGLTITHFLSESVLGLKNISLATTVIEAKSRKEYSLPGIKIPGLDAGIARKSLTLAKLPVEPIIARVNVNGESPSGEKVHEDYEVYYDAHCKAPGVYAYRKEPPRKKKVLLKPGEIVLKKSSPPRALHVKGLLFQHWKIAEALTKAGFEEKSAYLYTGLWQEIDMDGFPAGYDELLENSAIILNNVPANTLSDTQWEMTQDFVKAGGKLFVLGGLYAFGHGGYKEHGHSSFLPVKVEKVFDLMPVENTRITTKNSEIKKLGWDNNVGVHWIHQVKAKPKAEVLLQAGDNPFLIHSQYGQGDIYVLPGTPYGISTANATAFWEWEGWIGFLEKLFAPVEVKHPAARVRP